MLRIQPLRAPRDENIYECVAENSEGEITVNAKLSIIRGEWRGVTREKAVESTPPCLYDGVSPQVMALNAQPK